MNENKDKIFEKQQLDLLDKLQFIKGIGPKRAEAFIKEGIKSSKDLLLYFPRAYIDRSGSNSIRYAANILARLNSIDSETNISDFNFSPEITIIGKVIAANEHIFAQKRKMLKLIINDGSGVSASIIFWNKINIFKSLYKTGMILAISGKPLQDKFNSITYTHPEIDIIDEDDANVYKQGGILPKYRISEFMASSHITLKTLRTIMQNVIKSDLRLITESLPNHILEKYQLPNIQETIKNLHFPLNQNILQLSRYRIKFEEIFYFLLKVELSRQKIKLNEIAVSINSKSTLARKLYDKLPFELTSDQKKFLRDVADDIKNGQAMNRLLQGDVGSGKTIVAFLSMLMFVEEGYQCAFMAPTEVLAEQHYKNFLKYAEDLEIKVVQLVGGQKKLLRNNILDEIRSGQAKIIVGTHALFQSDIEYNKLALVVIDEQHRFGVEQRADLIKLSKMSYENRQLSPHVLVMSATPIPRTLTMTAYGDLDVSIIKTMPKNRKAILTRVVFDSQRQEVYEFVRNEIKKGHQIFIVYPLVEKSEKIELKAAIEHYEQLSKEIFTDLRCGLIHGQMFWYEKEEAMQAFLNREFDILVSTTVIEVGIDIPNATVMIIEDAERFGLSQLHQLRGRVGRGSEQSYCFLITKDKFKYKIKSMNDEDERTSAIVRLKTMQETSDGFKIAEVDLKLRGPGDILGTKQSGMPEFKYLDLINDADIISNAKIAVQEILKDDPKLQKAYNSLIKEQLYVKYGISQSYIQIA